MNEALQFLTKKRNRSAQTLEEFRLKSSRTVLISKTLDALALDEDTAEYRTDEYKAEMKKQQMLKATESKRAQALANDLLANIDAPQVEDKEKTKEKENMSEKIKQ